MATVASGTEDRTHRLQLSYEEHLSKDLPCPESPALGCLGFIENLLAQKCVTARLKKKCFRAASGKNDERSGHPLTHGDPRISVCELSRFSVSERERRTWGQTSPSPVRPMFDQSTIRFL
jgi:hypothetical protein